MSVRVHTSHPFESFLKSLFKDELTRFFESPVSTSSPPHSEARTCCYDIQKKKKQVKEKEKRPMRVWC